MSYYDNGEYERRYHERAMAVASSSGIGPRACGTSADITNCDTNVTFNITFNIGTPTPEVMNSLEAIKNAIETDKTGFAELLVSSGVVETIVQRSDNQQLADGRGKEEPAQRRGIFGFLGRGK